MEIESGLLNTCRQFSRDWEYECRWFAVSQLHCITGEETLCGAKSHASGLQPHAFSNQRCTFLHGVHLFALNDQRVKLTELKNKQTNKKY